MTFRNAQKLDAKRIAKLHALSWQTSYKGMLSEAYLNNQVFPERFAVWGRRLAKASDNQFIALVEDRNHLLGFACVFANYDEMWGAYLDNLHSHPDAQGQGIGKTLMELVAKWLIEEHDTNKMYLLVFEVNRAACDFYERRGGVKKEVLKLSMPDGSVLPAARYVWDRASLDRLAFGSREND